MKQDHESLDLFIGSFIVYIHVYTMHDPSAREQDIIRGYHNNGSTEQMLLIN